MRVITHPARYRIGAKGQSQRGDGLVAYSVTGDRRDFQWLYVHGDAPVW